MERRRKKTQHRHSEASEPITTTKPAGQPVSRAVGECSIEVGQCGVVVCPMNREII